MTVLTRRRLFSLGAAGGGLVLAGCDALTSSPSVTGVIRSAEGATRRWQRLVSDRNALAREFTAADMSPVFKANGTTEIQDPAYVAHADTGFADWKLVIDGLVNTPLSLSLAQLKSMPQRTQITRHDCVEGWSAIGQWTGPQLGTLLKAANLKTNARYLVLHCADNYGGEISKGGAQSMSQYYESVDLVDGFHPQSILAHSMNGAPLTVAHGAPIRLRVERQLGYKHAKYVMRIQAVDTLAGLYGGKGGYWEDRGYEWYAGI